MTVAIVVYKGLIPVVGRILTDEECVSDEILDKFDKTLEEKDLGDDYFQKKEERLKEMELEHELHEFAIDEMLNE